MISFLKFSHVNNLNVLCAVGEYQGTPTVLKLWNLDTLLSQTNKQSTRKNQSNANNGNVIDGTVAPPLIDSSHRYLTSVKVQNGTNQFPLSTFTITSDFSLSAFGFANGTTILVRGNLLNDKGSRQRVIYESNGEPITGVHLFVNKAASDYHLYVLTTSKILLFETTGRSQNVPLSVLENNLGSNLFCNDVIKSNNNLVVSNSVSSSIDFYNFKFGKVNSIKVAKNLTQNRLYNYNDKYLLLVASVENDFALSVINEGSDNNSPTPSSSLFNGTAGAVGNENSGFKTTKVLVIDYTHNFIIFNFTIPNNINHIATINGNLYLLSSNGILYKLQEKSIKEKIQIMIQRDLYPDAIRLIEEELAINKYSAEITKKDWLLIKKKYGDYLYEKNELQESVEQYIGSIDLNNNSYNLDIILKFKDNDKILYLTEYLEHLCFTNKRVFEKQLIKSTNNNNSNNNSDTETFVNEDYLTLLLCNYCKLKDRAKLNNFINELESIKQNYNNQDDPYEEDLINYSNLNFNIDLIIDLLLKINFNKITLKISFIFKHYSMILDILINKFKNYELCIVFLRFLKINDIFNVLLTNSTNSNYLKVLLAHIPLDTTKLLIDIFTGTYKPTVSESYIYDQFASLSNDTDDSSSRSSSSYKDSATGNKGRPAATGKKLNGTGTPSNQARSLLNEDTHSANNVALQSYNAFVQYLSSTANNTLTLMNLSDNISLLSGGSGSGSGAHQQTTTGQPTYQPPKPRLVFMSFVNNPNEFVIFLEACLQSYDKFDQFNTNIKDKTDLLITLFEMYLNLANQYPDESQVKKSWESKAIALYKNHKDFMDYNTILLLCHLNDFSDDELLLNFDSSSESSNGPNGSESGSDNKESTLVDEKSAVASNTKTSGTANEPKETRNERLRAKEDNLAGFKFDIADLTSEFSVTEKLPENHPTLLIQEEEEENNDNDNDNDGYDGNNLGSILSSKRNGNAKGDEETNSAYNKIELLRTSLNAGNIGKSVDILNKFGREVPELYSMTLFFVIKKNSEDFLVNKFGLKNFLVVLNKLLKSNIISIIDLINILSINDLVKFKFLKKFLINYFEFKKSEVDKNNKLLDYYSKEIGAKKQEIAKLLASTGGAINGGGDAGKLPQLDSIIKDLLPILENSSYTTASIPTNANANTNTSGDNNDENFLVINNLKCNLCGQSLDFPIVHFMCSHSYHQRCLNDFEYDSYTEGNFHQHRRNRANDGAFAGTEAGAAASAASASSTVLKCPKCVSELEAVNSLRAAQEEIGEKNHLFEVALLESDDKFKVINDFFGRGAMEHSRFIFDS